MSTKHTPATPLPWHIHPRDPAMIMDAPEHTVIGDVPKANAAYIAHTANAYPKLVDALRAQLDFARAQGNNKNATVIAALLRELGEE